MIKLGIVGCNGKLGTAIISYLLQNDVYCLDEAICSRNSTKKGSIVEKTSVKISDNISGTSDVYIDCTNVMAFRENIVYYKKFLKPIIIATTGFNENDFRLIKELSEVIPVMYAPNLSLNLYRFIVSIQSMAKTIDKDTDIAITELHHNQKIDAPSGTAIRIRDALVEVGIDSSKIQINSIRGGNIFGEHRVLFACETDEEIEFIHKTSSRKTFADGAIKAAGWILENSPGYYKMEDMFK